MRAIVTAADALLGTTWALALLVELDVTVPIYIATCRDDLLWPDPGGNLYLGGRNGAIEAIKDQGGEVVGLQFALSGVQLDMIALALAEPIQGKAAKVSLAMMTPDTQDIEQVILLWTGNLDQMPITEQGDTATIAVTAEHRGVVFARPKGILYSDAEQQRAHPDDRCLEFLTAQAAHLDTWPAAGFFKS